MLDNRLLNGTYYYKNILVMQFNVAVHTSVLDAAICTDFFFSLVESQKVPENALF